jgi:hypothetical protein
VYSAAEGGFDRIRASARRLMLLGPGKLRCVLVAAGAIVPSTAAGRFPMFDEVHPDFPTAEKLMERVA